MDPDVVPEKLENKINYWVIILIIGLTIAFQFSLYFLAIYNMADQAVYVVSITSPLCATAASFVVAKRYFSSKTFGKAYLALGGGYLVVTIAEVLYFVYDYVLQIEPYPSPADVLFFALYPFIFVHLVLNIRFFKPKISIKELLWMISIPTIIIASYISFSLVQIEEVNFDFYYGLVFAIEPAVILPFAILGAKIFKGGILGTAWAILVLAIIAYTVGDVWYYYLEIFDDYTLLHPVNLFWYAGYWIAVYALYKHRKNI